jgi:uncharacterized protein YdeI (BOF family)
MKVKFGVMTLALSGALALGPALFAQQSPSTPSTQDQQQSPTPSTTPLPDRTPEQQTPEAQTSQSGSASGSQAMQPAMKSFSGTIVKVSDKYVLQDNATNTKYELDNQSTAKQYEGKQVTVTGSLDASSSMLHVETIELAK